MKTTRSNGGAFVCIAAVTAILSVRSAAGQALPSESPQCQYPDARIITHLYRDLLGRRADEAEAFRWAARAEETGTPSSDFARFMVRSDEYRRRQVALSYREFLGREAGEDEMEYWSAFDTKGMTIGIVISNEFAGPMPGSGNPVALRAWRTSWIKNLYKGMLGRTPQAEEAKDWRLQLQKGVPPEQLAAIFYDSHEHHALLAEKMYLTLLRRPSEPGARQAWAGGMDADSSITAETLAAMFAGSEEYLAGVLQRRVDVCAPPKRGVSGKAAPAAVKSGGVISPSAWNEVRAPAAAKSEGVISPSAWHEIRAHDSTFPPLRPPAEMGGRAGVIPSPGRGSPQSPSPAAAEAKATAGDDPAVRGGSVEFRTLEPISETGSQIGATPVSGSPLQFSAHQIRLPGSAARFEAARGRPQAVKTGPQPRRSARRSFRP